MLNRAILNPPCLIVFANIPSAANKNDNLHMLLINNAVSCIVSIMNIIFQWVRSHMVAWIKSSRSVFNETR